MIMNMKETTAHLEEFPNFTTISFYDTRTSERIRVVKRTNKFILFLDKNGLADTFNIILILGGVSDNLTPGNVRLPAWLGYCVDEFSDTKKLKKLNWKELIWYLENKRENIKMDDIISLETGVTLYGTDIDNREYTKLNSMEREGLWTIEGIYE